MNTDIESFKLNFQIFLRGMDSFKEKMSEQESYGDRLSKCEREIEDLKKEVAKANRPVFQGGEGIDSDAIDNMLDNFKKEMHLLFARRDDVENLKSRVGKLEEDYKTMDKNLNDTTDNTNKNTEEIEKLKKLLDGKLDCDTFDNEISKLTEAIQNAGGDVSKVASNSNGGSFGTKDVNRIKDMLDKFPDLEKAIEEIKKKLKETASKKELADVEKDISDKLDRTANKLFDELKALKDLLNQLSREFDFLKASGAGSGGDSASPDIVIQITNKIEKLEIKLGNLENELNSMRRDKNKTVSMPSQPVSSGPSIDPSKIDSLEHKINQLDSDFKKFNNEIVKEIKNHQDQINGKVDYSQLEELKEFLLGKIDELMRGFKQFADKNETKKALKNLEKQLKNLYDLVMSKAQGSGIDEDDAMFSKKHLWGFSCASCEKNLINLCSKPPDHYSWNKFPLRDPAERIARVGQGFSRMLSSMKPEQASRFQGVSTKYPPQEFDEEIEGNKDHSQPVRTQQNFYPG